MGDVCFMLHKGADFGHSMLCCALATAGGGEDVRCVLHVTSCTELLLLLICTHGVTTGGELAGLCCYSFYFLFVLYFLAFRPGATVTFVLVDVSKTHTPATTMSILQSQCIYST